MTDSGSETSKRWLWLLGVAVLSGAAYLGLRRSAPPAPSRAPDSATEQEALRAPDPAPNDSPAARPPPPQRSTEAAAEPTPPTPAFQVAARPPTEAELPKCPASEPADGSSCEIPETAAIDCGYGEGSTGVNCTCDGAAGDAAKWRCLPAGANGELTLCPADHPAASSACSLPGQTCFYGEADTAEICRCEHEKHTWACVPHAQWAGERH